MNVNPGYLFGLFAFLLTALFAVLWTRRARGLPITREQQLEGELAELNREIIELKTKSETLNGIVVNQARRIALLEDQHRRDEAKIRDMETRLSHFESTSPARGKPTARRQKKLAGEDLKALRELLLTAYTSKAHWTMLLNDIDHTLDVEALGDSMNEVAAKILTKANNEGWLASLIAHAADQVPLRKDIEELTDILLKALEV